MYDLLVGARPLRIKKSFPTSKQCSKPTVETEEIVVKYVQN